MPLDSQYNIVNKKRPEMGRPSPAARSDMPSRSAPVASRTMPTRQVPDRAAQPMADRAARPGADLARPAMPAAKRPMARDLAPERKKMAMQNMISKYGKA